MLIELAITGLLIALLPLVIVWFSRDTNKFRKLAWVTVFLTFDLIMFGAFTRLTDSGLGCPDWPGCYGHANPLQAKAHIDAAVLMMPDGPVTFSKAWIEMIHRYLATAVGVLTIALMSYGWRRWHAHRKNIASLPSLPSSLPSSSTASWIRPPGPWLPTVALLCICVQGAFGAWTVTMKLQPLIVTTHLLLGLTLLALLIWLAARETPRWEIDHAARRLATPALACLLLLVVQVALGGWVSTNYAALACQEFPRCQDAWLPAMDFQQGFTLWRKLGMTASGDYLSFAALTAIHWTHRMFAILVALCIFMLGRAASRLSGLDAIGKGLMAAVILQCCTGLATVFFNWPLAIAVLHTGGSSLLLGLLVMINYRTRLAVPPAEPLYIDASDHAQPVSGGNAATSFVKSH